MDTITIGGTKIHRFDNQDRKDLKVSFRYAVEQDGKIKGLKTLSQVKKLTGIKLSPNSFKK